MANVGQWRASSVASNEPPAAPCKPDGPLRWLTKPSSGFWPTSSAGSGHIPDLKAFNRASLEFKVGTQDDRSWRVAQPTRLRYGGSSRSKHQIISCAWVRRGLGFLTKT